MNIENDFLTDFDLFGKNPEFYYKGRSKKSSIFGIILTVIYIILYIAFLVYKLIRMFKRVDVTFYDSYTFQGIPSIPLTNNEFYGGFGMGGIVDEKMYYLELDYVSQVRVNGEWETNRRRLETEICQIEKFGSEFQGVFSDLNLDKYYCIKDMSDMVMEGYSNLERYSFLNVRFYPCANYTKNGEKCYDYWTKYAFFVNNVIECKFQDNDLNPEDYETPVLRRRLDLNSPVFKDLFQLIYSYLQIVNIETDEDITGLNFFSDHIRKQVYTRYDETFIIASPLFYGDILVSGGPIADVTLQLAAKVLTEKRQYMQLIDVLGDVGGLMEILYTFLNMISSFITEILYDKSLVNNLFSFDLNKKYVVFNRPSKHRSKERHEHKHIKDSNKRDSMNFRQNFEEGNKNNEAISKENSGDDKTISKNNVSSSRKKIIKKRKGSQASTFKNDLAKFNEQNIPNENIKASENKLSLNENKNKIDIYNVAENPLGTNNETYNSMDGDLKNIYINYLFICCFWCSSKKRNLNRILFEEGSKIITKRLDIMNMFNKLYVVEIIQKNLGIEYRGMSMTSNCKNSIKNYNMNNDFKDVED